jgi:tetrahydromethanopterin S-methyltransferase subunit B
MKVIIDRFEGPYAVCEREDKTMMDIKRIKLPIGAKEGYVLDIHGDKITIDVEETENRKKHMECITKDMWN